MCAVYVRCALSVLQKECRNVWGARYTLGARYRSENTVIDVVSAFVKGLHTFEENNQDATVLTALR